MYTSHTKKNAVLRSHAIQSTHVWVTQHVFDQIHPTFTLTDPGSVSTDFCYDLFGIPLFMPDNCLKVLSQFKYYILPLHTWIQNFFFQKGRGRFI